MMRRGVPAQRGVGLIEIMISLVLGLLIVGALFQMHLSVRQTQRLQDALTSRQESLRFATLLITRDLRMAGYRGCLRDTGLVRNTLNTPNGYLYAFDRPIQGFEAVAGGWSPALDASLGTVVEDTDVLTVRTTLDPGVLVRQEMPTAAADVKVTQDLAPPPFEAAGGDIVLITDCGGAAIFQITQFTNAAGNIVHNSGAGAGLPDPGNATKDLGRRFPVGSQVIKLATISYFIRESADGNGPALWRRIGGADPQELVNGIENMQLLYGEDLDGDRVPDAYRRANAVGDWRNVSSVRVGLLATSLSGVVDEDPRQFQVLDVSVGPFDDRRLRRVIEFSVSVRNRLP